MKGRIDETSPAAEAGDDKADELLQRVRGLSHDLNNLLQVAILGIEAPEASSDEVLAALAEAVTLTREMLYLGSTPAVADAPLLLTPAIQSAVARLVPLLGKRVSVESRFEAVDARAHVDVATLQQAIRNLALNARAAMPNGGHLWIDLGERVKDGREVIEISVTDDGEGIAADVIAKLDEAPVSTRPGGNGLGLTLVRSRLALFGGSLAIMRRQETGTRAVVTLPKAPRPDSAPT